MTNVAALHPSDLGTPAGQRNEKLLNLTKHTALHHPNSSVKTNTGVFTLMWHLNSIGSLLTNKQRRCPADWVLIVHPLYTYTQCSRGSVVEHCVSSANGCGFNSQGTHKLT